MPARPAVLREVEIGRRTEFCALAIVELEIGEIRRVFALACSGRHQSGKTPAEIG
jgi:hypothetical protein